MCSHDSEDKILLQRNKMHVDWFSLIRNAKRCPQNLPKTRPLDKDMADTVCRSAILHIFPTFPNDLQRYVLTPVFSILKNRNLVLPLQVTRDSQSVSIQAAMFLKLHATTHARNFHRVLPFCRTRKNQLQRYMGTTKMPLPSVGSNELSFWVAPTHSLSSEPPTRNTWSNGLSNAPVAQLSYCRFFRFLILWMTY